MGAATKFLGDDNSLSTEHFVCLNDIQIRSFEAKVQPRSRLKSK